MLGERWCKLVTPPLGFGACYNENLAGEQQKTGLLCCSPVKVFACSYLGSQCLTNYSIISLDENNANRVKHICANHAYFYTPPI